jgi:hypothetical protein
VKRWARGGMEGWIGRLSVKRDVLSDKRDLLSVKRDLLKETYYLEWRDGLGEGWVCYLPQYLYISLVKHFKSKINEDGGGPVNLFLDFIL